MLPDVQSNGESRELAAGSLWSVSLPITTMELVSLFSFCLFFGSSRQYLLTIGEALDDSLERGHTSLNEMFREVEMLMGDTQFILAEAVDQVHIPIPILEYFVGLHLQLCRHIFYSLLLGDFNLFI